VSKTIVVPLDGTVTSERIVPYAVALARMGSELLLVRVPVIPQPVLENPLVDDAYREKYKARVQVGILSYLDEWRERLEAQGCKVRTRLIDGDPVEQIAALTKSEKASAVLLCTQTRSEIGRESAFAKGICRAVECPTLLLSLPTQTEATASCFSR